MAHDDHSASRRADVLREEAPALVACPKCGSSDLLHGVTPDDREDGTAECEHCGAQIGPGRVEIVARFDVAGFDARQVDALVGELCAQAEGNELHPDAEVLEMSTPVLPREGRTILVHVNLTLPPDAPATAEDVAREIEAALEIAAEDPSGNAPALQTADLVEIALAEEI